MKEVKNPREFPELQEFIDFLESKFMALEVMQGNNQKLPTANKPWKSEKPFNNVSETKNNNTRRSTYFNKPQNSSKVFFTSVRNCPICKTDHVLMKCDKFVAMSAKAREETVRNMHIC